MSVAFETKTNTPTIRFLASLSDGRTVIQDDVAGKQHAWIRLQKFLANNSDLKITGLRLQGPGGKEFVMPANQQGYFFGKKARKVFPGGEADYVGLGYYDGHTVSVCYHKLPKLDHQFTEDKTKAQAGFMLIENA